MTDLTNCPPKLREALQRLSPAAREAWMDHLRGGTSADYLAGWLTRAGFPMGATSVKTYRQKVTA